jgi:hypothetical protein
MLDFLVHSLANELIQEKRFSRLSPALIYATDVLKTMSDAEIVSLIGRTIRTMAIQKSGENDG